MRRSGFSTRSAPHGLHLPGAILALVFTCAGCTQKMAGSTYAPTQMQTGHSAQELYDAAVRVLTGRGYDVASRDPAAFVVQTAYVERDEPPVAQLQYAWRVTTAGGVLNISSLCKYNDGWGYDDCPSTIRPAGLIEEEGSMSREIVAAAATPSP